MLLRTARSNLTPQQPTQLLPCLLRTVRVNTQAPAHAQMHNMAQAQSVQAPSLAQNTFAFSKQTGEHTHSNRLEKITKQTHSYTTTPLGPYAM